MYVIYCSFDFLWWMNLRIRLKYRQAMDTGKHSGHGCVMLLYYKLCESIWEGSPATQQLTQQLASSLESGDITSTLQADGDADIAIASSESPTDTSGKEGDVSNNDSLTESQSLNVKQRRNCSTTS